MEVRSKSFGKPYQAVRKVYIKKLLIELGQEEVVGINWGQVEADQTTTTGQVTEFAVL